jgi:citronellol/citronellal dehydrogenase
MTDLRGRTLFITGASRGIGKAIALRAARDGANVVVAAKTVTAHARLPGTIHSAAEEIEAAGGKALAVQVDIRSEEEVEAAVAKAVEAFGGIDILINNASAIMLTGTVETPMKRYDLMHHVNTRGTFLCGQKCIPHLAKSGDGRIVNIAPPLNLDPRWFGPHVAYTMAKYGMSMCTLGWAEELRSKKIAATSLWPRTAIDTAAVRNLLGGEESARRCRSPEIMADAAHVVLTRPQAEVNGKFLIDDDVLTSAGVTDLSKYTVDRSAGELMPDFFL